MVALVLLPLARTLAAVAGVVGLGGADVSTCRVAAWQGEVDEVDGSSAHTRTA